VFNSVEGYNDDDATFLRRRFTPRAYSDVAMLREICEHPARTRARIAAKRTLLGGVRAVMGGRYDRLRTYVVSAFRRR